jgi:hypothetical protein
MHSRLRAQSWNGDIGVTVCSEYPEFYQMQQEAFSECLSGFADGRTVHFWASLPPKSGARNAVVRRWQSSEREVGLAGATWPALSV